MERKALEVFSEAPNQGVVRMPGRRLPGRVVRGDSLSILHSLARSVSQRVASAHDQELAEDAAELANLLEQRLRHYEAVMAEHGSTCHTRGDDGRARC